MAFLLSPAAYAAMLAVYAVSLLLFFADFLRDNRAANRIGLTFLGVVWILETAFMGARIAADHRLPFFTSGQATVFYAWLLVTVSGIVSLFSRIDFFAFFVNLLGFLFVAFDTFVHGRGANAYPRQSDLLLLHISFAFLSYLAFALSCIWSVLYLLEDSALRGKRFSSGSFRRLPALEKLDGFAYRTALTGLPLLLIAIVLGFIWYAMLTGRVLLIDAKTVTSVLLLAVYGAYAWLRASGRFGGRRGAWLNIGAFLGVVLNFLVVGEFMSRFHRW